MEMAEGGLLLAEESGSSSVAEHFALQASDTTQLNNQHPLHLTSSSKASPIIEPAPPDASQACRLAEEAEAEQERKEVELIIEGYQESLSFLEDSSIPFLKGMSIYKPAEYAADYQRILETKKAWEAELAQAEARLKHLRQVRASDTAPTEPRSLASPLKQAWLHSACFDMIAGVAGMDAVVGSARPSLRTPRHPRPGQSLPIEDACLPAHRGCLPAFLHLRHCSCHSLLGMAWRGKSCVGPGLGRRATYRQTATAFLAM